MINLPIYRAKKIDSAEYNWGYLIKADDYDADEDEDRVVYFIIHKMENYRTNEVWDFVCNSRIDPTTLSIHFPNMIDSQGNKIFASLNENRKGGDILIEEGRYEDGFNPIFEPYFRKSSLSIFDLPKTPYGEYQLKHYKIIGIQE